jgi:transcriptional regulator with XRE-family HTH domain
MLARKLAGMTIDQAAVAAGVKPSSWANWEAGRRPQRETDILGMIADALDIDEHWLTYGGKLTSAMGRPTGRSESDTDGYSASDLGFGPEYATYPIPTDRPMAAVGGPANLRPKGREDRTRPMSPSPTGRRATLVR